MRIHQWEWGNIMFRNFFIFTLVSLYALSVSGEQSDSEQSNQNEPTQKYNTQFCPNSKTCVNIEFTEGEMIYRIYTENREVKYGKKNIYEEMESIRSLSIFDYDFNDDLDFSISSLDGGKGKYTIHKVFLFSRENNDFVEKDSVCGEPFYELTVDEKKQQLLSIYWRNNLVRTCITKLKKMK
jgi:hypothetical protein